MPRTKPITAKELPLFAQPIRQCKPQHTSVMLGSRLSSVTVLSLSVVACSALLLAAQVNRAQDSPASASKGKAKSAQTAPKSGDSALTVEPVVEETSSGRHPLAFYTQGVRAGMFSPPLPPTPKHKPIVVVKPAPKPLPLPIVPVMVINPFADWAYTGTIKMGDQTMALLENTKTKEGQYVKAGDSFMGAQVASVTDQQVLLTNAGKPTMLAKSDNINLVPLNSSAGAPGGGGAPPAANPNPGGGPPPGMPPPMQMPAMSFNGMSDMVIEGGGISPAMIQSLRMKR